MDLRFKLPVFEGPLELLLHLIDKNKVDIYDIPIAMITDQYFEYLRAMEEADLDIMSDFIVMAATLLDIKARMLLPHDEEDDTDEGDPRRELVERLLEYKKFKYIGGELKDMGFDGFMSLYSEERLPAEVKRYKPPVDLDEVIGDMTAQRLREILEEVANRSHERINEAVRSYGHLEKETIPIESRISHVKQVVKGGKKKSFRALLSESASKTEVIVTFLAILELLKTGEIKLTEDSTSDDFTIEEKTDCDTADNEKAVKDNAEQ